jgi:CheY-like chemotaxis protein
LALPLLHIRPDVVYGSRCVQRGASLSAQRRALVVDDDAAIRIMLTRVLARDGFTVDAARDGAEAIEKIIDHHYDVIALDVMMPRIDGIGVVKFLAERQPEHLHRVIVMTAYGASALSQVCPPVERFIEKPFEIENLIAQATDCLTVDDCAKNQEPPDIMPS